LRRFWHSDCGLPRLALCWDVQPPTVLLCRVNYFVRPHVTAGVGGVKHTFKVVGVVFPDGADVAFADQLVFPSALMLSL